MRKLLIVAALAGVITFGWSPTTASADTSGASPTSDPLQQQLQAQLAQQQALAATKQSLASEVQAAQDEQTTLAGVIQANQTAIQQTLQQLAAAEERFHDASVRQADEHAAAVLARQQERADKALLAAYVRERYVSQNAFVDFILSSSSISEMLSRASDLSHVIDSGDQLTTKVQQDAAAAEAAEAAAKKDADAAQAAANALDAQRQTLADQTTKAQSLISQLGTQERAANAEIASADQQSLAVAEEIAATRIAQLDATIAAAEAADWQAAEYWIQQHLGVLPTGFATTPATQGSATFAWPAPGSIISQPFGPSPYTFEPPFDGYPHFHTGLDLARGLGAPILAAADGVVVVAGFSDVGYGNHIIIAHAGGFLTLYGHLETMLVQPGATVKQGQLIGLMGSTGNSTGPHLHFEVRFNNTPTDPIPFLPPLPPGASGPPA